MQIIYGAVLMVMLILNLFLAFIIRQIVVITNQQVRKHVTRELETCTAALDQKLLEYRELEEKRQQLEKTVAEQEKKAQAKVVSEASAPQFSQGYGLFYQSGVSYRSEGALETYRYIKDHMKLDHKAIVRQAVARGEECRKQTEQTRLWEFCCRILEKITHEEIFRLTTMSAEKQSERLKELLTGPELEAMEQIAPSEQIPDLIGRMDKLRQYRMLYDPQPRIRSGEKYVDRNMNEGVRYEYDPQIHEGVCVRVGTDIIDYSL